jgi:catechol 2,3-dioxygenase-like lactoylglutathione lyase family enzyme
MTKKSEAAISDFEFKHHHISISVPELQPSMDWYHDKLGFEFEFEFEVPDVGLKAVVMRRGELRVEIMRSEGASTLPSDRRDPDLDIKTHGNKHAGFAVRDVRATIEALERQNVEIVRDLGVAVYVHDNFGNLLEFVEQPDLWD